MRVYIFFSEKFNQINDILAVFSMVDEFSKIF